MYSSQLQTLRTTSASSLPAASASAGTAINTPAIVVTATAAAAAAADRDLNALPVESLLFPLFFRMASSFLLQSSDIHSYYDQHHNGKDYG